MRKLNEVEQAVKNTEAFMSKLAKRDNDNDRAVYNAVRDWLLAHTIEVKKIEKYGSRHVDLNVGQTCCYHELTAFVELFGTED